MTPIKWFGGYVGVMRLTDWTLHLRRDDGTTFCGKEVSRLVSAREANSPKCEWCETCLRGGQAERRDLSVVTE